MKLFLLCLIAAMLAFAAMMLGILLRGGGTKPSCHGGLGSLEDENNAQCQSCGAKSTQCMMEPRRKLSP
jgi:hypothetical protein